LLEAIDRTRDHRSEHRAIVDAVMERDRARAVSLLQQHYTRTAETLISSCKELE
jgi:DNA-binding GntR family transcriptional regulator